MYVGFYSELVERLFKVLQLLRSDVARQDLRFTLGVGLLGCIAVYFLIARRIGSAFFRRIVIGGAFSVVSVRVLPGRTRQQLMEG